MAIKKKKPTPVKTRKTAVSKGSKSDIGDTAEIRDLIEFIAQTGLNEVNIETQALKLHVKRDPDQTFLRAASDAGLAPIQAPVSSPSTTPPPAAKETPAPESSNTLEVRSPMIGTFYRSANPDSPPYASVGDKISKGQTLCIIEAMKLFNEIESEVSGTIVKALVENATPVEYDQVLFVIEPD